jgi:hypothetical protein
MPQQWNIDVQFEDLRTGETSSTRIQTNDPDVKSNDPKRVDEWLNRVRAQYALQHGWDFELTMATIDEESRAAAINGRMHTPKDRTKRAIRIHVSNTHTGQSHSALVQTNDPDAVSTDPARLERWRQTIIAQFAREEKWDMHHIKVDIEGEGEAAPIKKANVRIRATNTRTGQSHSATVDTTDPDALSTDPARRERWVRHIASRTVTTCFEIYEIYLSNLSCPEDSSSP